MGEGAGDNSPTPRRASAGCWTGWPRTPGPDGVHLIIEPTSACHHPLVQTLAESGVAYTLINPARTAALARARGKRAKTDPVDARLPASLGETQQPEASPPPREGQERLKALGRHPGWLEGERQAARNRLDTARFSPWTPAAAPESLDRAIDRLTEEIRAAQEAMTRQPEQDSAWVEQLRLLTPIPGVGQRTATLLLAEMPPVGRCDDAGSWAAFCGLAPEPRQSGKTRHSRLSRQGSARVRSGLYLPAISAPRWNPAVRDRGQRLRDRGKNRESARRRRDAPAAPSLLWRAEKWSTL